MYFLSTDIPDTTTLRKGISSVHGISKKQAQQAINLVRLEKHTTMVELTTEQRDDMVNHFQSTVWGRELEQVTFDSLRALTLTRTYRAVRHQRGLPVRGQRTSTNRQTCRRVRALPVEMRSPTQGQVLRTRNTKHLVQRKSPIIHTKSKSKKSDGIDSPSRQFKPSSKERKTLKKYGNVPKQSTHDPYSDSPSTIDEKVVHQEKHPKFVSLPKKYKYTAFE